MDISSRKSVPDFLYRKRDFGHFPKQPSVGIVTRTKDRAVLLRRALESVKNQTYSHWNLVVVNDGGDPAPVDQLVRDAFGEGETRVKVLHHPESLGMEAASNAGLQALECDLAIIHDDDDSWAPEMLRVATEVLLEQNSRVSSIRAVAVGLNVVYETVAANHVQIESVEKWVPSIGFVGEGPLSIGTAMGGNPFPPIALLFDLKKCKELGGFNADLPVLGDWDFLVRFIVRWDVWVHPENLAFYHIRKQATGALGNSVTAGIDKHKLYAPLIRNYTLRSLASDDTASPEKLLTVLMLEQSKQIEKARNDLVWQMSGQLDDQLKSMREGGVPTRLGRKLSKLFRFSRKRSKDKR